MNRPSQTWILFGLSLVVAVVALGRVTFAALNLEESQRRAELESQREERIQRALARVEGWLNLLIAREEDRSSEEYEAFVRSSRAYVRVDDGFAPEEVVVPSPLLGIQDTNLWLHFELRPDGVLSSPQIPSPPYRTLIESFGMAELVSASEVRLGRLKALLNSTIQEESTTNIITHADRLMSVAMSGWADMAEVRDATGQGRVGGMQRGRMMSSSAASEWLMVRRVEDAYGNRAQGFWLNWPVVRLALVRVASEVLPDADIRLAGGESIEDDGRRLFRVRGAVLELIPGVVDVVGATGWSPVRVTLGLA